jgi:hypothetical protein
LHGVDHRSVTTNCYRPRFGDLSVLMVIDALIAGFIHIIVIIVSSWMGF